MNNPFGDLYLCELCGAFIGPEDTEQYFENHGHNGAERLSRTTCCRASYTDVDGQTIIDFLGEIRDIQRPATKGYVLPSVILSQIRRDNLDAIISILETTWEL